MMKGVKVSRMGVVGRDVRWPQDGFGLFLEDLRVGEIRGLDDRKTG